ERKYFDNAVRAHIERLELILENRSVEMRFRGEVAVEGVECDAGLFGHLLHLHCVFAVVDRQGPCNPDDVLIPLPTAGIGRTCRRSLNIQSWQQSSSALLVISCPNPLPDPAPPG